MLGHFCLPFAPICYVLHYKEQRRKRIQAILDKYNVLLFDRGYHWCVTSVFYYCVCVCLTLEEADVVEITYR